MRNKEPYQSFFLALPLPAMILKPLDAGFLILEANEAFCNITGTKQEDIAGKEVKDAFPVNPEQAQSGYDLLAASFKEIQKTGKPQKVQSLRYDIPLRGTSQFVERYWTSDNIPIYNEQGELEFVIHISQDVTEQILAKKNEKNVQNEIFQLRDQYHHFIDSNPDAMYSLDRTGKFLSANEGTCKLIQIPLEDLLQMDFLPLCAPDDKDRIWSYFEKAIAGESVKLEANFVSGKGKRLVLSINLVPMIINGAIAGAYGIAKDVTDLRASEKIIIEKRKFLEVNSAFISVLLEKDLEHETLQKAFANVGKTINVDRTYYFTRHKDARTGNDLYSLKNEWSNPHVTSQLDNPKLQDVQEEDLREVLIPLRKNKPFFASCEEVTSGPVKEAFQEQEIKSMLLYPIFVEQQFHGFIGFDDCTQRRVWTEDEITFLRMLAHNLANALEKKAALQQAKQKDEDLQIGERKFRSLVQEGSDLIAILDCDGNYLFTSDNSIRIIGFEAREFLGRNAFEFIHPDDAERLQEELMRIKDEKQVLIPPFRFKDKNNGWRWLETTATNLLEDPAVGGIVTNSRDVTPLVEQAHEIEQINERYALAARATEDLIYDWDLVRDEVVRFHESSRKIFGYPAEELRKKEFWIEHIHPEDRKKEYRKLKRFLNSPNTHFIRTEYRFRKADGSYAHVVDKGYILRDQQGKPTRLIGATSDVSDIAEKEEALSLANTRFELAMKATDEIIWDWDVTNDFITRSEAFEIKYGYKNGATSFVYNFWLEKVVTEDRERVRNSLLTALKDPARTKWREEYCLRKEDGSLAYVIDRGYIVRDKKGNAIRVVGAILDVTQSRRLIRDIKKQNDGLKEIAWKQSHEVRAPLARLKGLVDLLKSNDFQGLNRDEILGHIFCSADELDRIIREIVEKTEHIEISHKEGDMEGRDSGPVDVV